MAIRINQDGRISPDGSPLIPDVAGLTAAVVEALDEVDRGVITHLTDDLGNTANIEVILTRVRRLALAIGTAMVHSLDGQGYNRIGDRICIQIGSIVNRKLPDDPNPYTELVSWIAGTHREHAIEIFTPNYDLLIEEAFERARIAFFDGFAGANKPFFDAVSVSSSDDLPSRWARLWKIHGSLGWSMDGDTVVRTGNREANQVIYPDHLKYDEIKRLPYSALFERLRSFLTTPDSLLICSGFSFRDSHISAVFDEALAANAHTAIFAFQYGQLDEEGPAVRLAQNRPNLSVYARDGAVISGIEGCWQLGEPLNDQWKEIRRTFWQAESPGGSGKFVLGDFARLARFFALTHAQQMDSSGGADPQQPNGEDGATEEDVNAKS